MVRIVDRQRERVTEHGHRFGEANTVLPLIGAVLLRVPLEPHAPTYQSPTEQAIRGEASPVAGHRRNHDYNAGAGATMAVEITRRRFTVDEYHRMACAGILTEDDRVELLDGEIVQMPPIGPGHSGSTIFLTRLFMRLFGDDAEVSVQNPVHLAERSEPKPDVALLHPRADSYRRSHATAEEIFLAVEVSDSTLDLELRVKVPMYGRAGVPEVWLIDLPHAVVHVYREPSPDGYRLTRTARRGERIAPLAFPDREVAVEDLLG
jgi:Uma2 family endonuclease